VPGTSGVSFTRPSEKNNKRKANDDGKGPRWQTVPAANGGADREDSSSSDSESEAEQVDVTDDEIEVLPEPPPKQVDVVLVDSDEEPEPGPSAVVEEETKGKSTFAGNC
jgi:hypothetical protein